VNRHRSPTTSFHAENIIYTKEQNSSGSEKLIVGETGGSLAGLYPVGTRSLLTQKMTF
jgi:hypothetical protein